MLATSEFEELDVALVLAVFHGALEADHLIGDAVYRVFHGGLARAEGLLDVRLASDVRRAALQQAQFDAAHLRARGFLAAGRQISGQAAQLRVAEVVLGHVLVGVFGDVHTVLIADALAHHGDALAVLGVDLLHGGQELVHIEGQLGQVDQIRAIALVGGQRGGSGQPARVAAHGFDDGDHAGVVHARVAIHFHAGGGDVLGGGAEGRAVVGAVQVVIDGLGDAHHAALIAVFEHELGNLVVGIHGIVAAIVGRNSAHRISLKISRMRL